MFGIRTPTKEISQKMEGSREKGSKTTLNVTVDGNPETEVPNVPKLKEKFESTPKEKVTFNSRLAEAKSQLMKAKLQIKNSRNLKTEIKNEVISAVERLYQLVKEAEEEKQRGHAGKLKEQEKEQTEETEQKGNEKSESSKLLLKIEEHSQLLKEYKDHTKELNETIKRHQELFEGKATYANVAARKIDRAPARPAAAVHSMVITSNDEKETGEEVLEKFRKAINAKEEGVRVEKIRKAKDRKVIVGFRTEEEMKRAKDKLKTGDELNVEVIKNKDPLVMFRDVLHYNSEEDILKALRNQNKQVFEGIGDEDRMEIKYRRKARNPLTSHVVMKVSPILWNRLINTGAVHIDLQKVKVVDQSPLIQCSRCLGYGHSRRFCAETHDVCSHCGGEHVRTECPVWMAEAPPECCNCRHAKLDKTNHNAFDRDCPVRRRWETIARSTIAYC